MSGPYQRPTYGGGSRPTTTGKKQSANAKWAGTSDQLKFRTKVLNSAIRQRTKAGRQRYKSLSKDKLIELPHAGKKDSLVRVKNDVGVGAIAFLTAAQIHLITNRGLLEEKIKKDKNHTLEKEEKEILNTLDVRISGYRSVATEKKLWLKYFPGYYNSTMTRRAKLGDPHGNDAVRLMVKEVGRAKAPPGFSKHTAGLSIDFQQKRLVVGSKNDMRDYDWSDKQKRKVHEKWVTNSTNKKTPDVPGNRVWWKKTFIYEWLHKNASKFNFKEYEYERWHYDYIGPKIF